MTFELFPPNLHEVLTSSLADFHAKTSQEQASAQVSADLVPASGPSTDESSPKSDPGSSSSKTSRGSGLPGSKSSSKTLPRSGMMRSGTVSPLPASAPLTSATGSSSSRGTPHECDFPTPSATASVSSGNGEGNNVASRGRPSLETMARKDLWPTPVVTDAKSSGRSNVTTGVMHPGVSLTDAARMWPTPILEDSQSRSSHGTLTDAARRWPTPTASDGTGGPGTSPKREGSMNLRTAAVGASSAPSPSTPGDPGASAKPGPVQVLNPSWVELLMGLPGDWTDGSEVSLGPSARLSVARMRARSAKQG